MTWLRSRQRVSYYFFLLFHAMANGQEWKTLPSATATVDATSFGIRIPRGTFAERKVNGRLQPGLTAVLTATATGDHFHLHKVNGNIWSATAWVPHPKLMHLLDAADLLHFSRYPRIHLSADADRKNHDGKPEIEELGDGKFLIHARVDVKDRADIPIDFQLVVTREGDGLAFKLHSVSTPDDKPHRGTKVSRKRLNLGGAAWLVDDGVILGGYGQIVPRLASDPPEEGDIFPETGRETPHDEKKSAAPVAPAQPAPEGHASVPVATEPSKP